jgi:putative membrane protein
VPSADRQEPGTDYRFTLANERTYLAYERTAIGLVAASVATLQLLDGWAYGLLGVLLLAAGAVAAVGGYVRFRRVAAAIEAGRDLPPNPVAHLLALAVVLCLVAAALAVVA